MQNGKKKMKTPIKQINVLNAGIVGLMEVRGDDMSAIDAARCTVGDFVDNHTQDENDNLVDYLMRKNHGTPFEFADVIFYIKVPLFVMQQILRHRIGVSINQESLRYVEPCDDFYIPSPRECKGKPENKKQGAGDLLNEERTSTAMACIRDLGEQCKAGYRFLIDSEEIGLANELARIVLPTGQYTRAYIKFNLRSIFHFAALRLDSHAQAQTREVGQALYDCVKEHFPVSCAAFENHVLSAKTFSADEWKILKQWVNLDIEGRDGNFKVFCKEQGLRETRIKEFLEKLQR